VLLTVAAALLLLVLYGTGHHRLALFVLVARGGAMILSTGLKAIVDRARPVFDEPVATALGGSFPSGHALGSAAFYAMIAVVLAPRLSRAGLLLTAAAAISVLVASSRVLLGVHFPSDVTAGLLIGWGWVALCTAVFAVWRREEGKPADQVGE
jgi:membrane-associated phospholipid phosphatase